MNDIAAKKKILIIDDDEFVRQSFASYLTDIGFLVLTAENGKMGVNLFSKNPPDIVLLDLRMPGMDGLEVLSAIREKSPQMPVLVISGTGDMTDAISALRLGAWDYLEKPLPDFDMLEHAINNALEKSRLIKENERYRKELESLVRKRTIELESSNEELNSVNRRLKLIVDAINKMTGCESTMELCTLLLTEIGSNMSAKGGSIYLFEKDHLKLCHSMDPDHSPEIIPLPMKENSIFYEALIEKKPILLNDIDKNADINLSGWHGYKANSALILPVLDDREHNPIAMISLHNKINRSFSSQDLEIAQILVSYAFKAISGAKAREKLENSETKFRTLVENLHGGIFVVDDQFKIIYANQELSVMLGDPELILIGQDFRNYLGEESLDLVTERYISRQRGEHVPSKYEIILRRLNGEKRYIELSSTVLRTDENKMETYAQIIDVTERKTAEESLKFALQEVESLKNKLQEENIYLREELKQEFNFDEIIGQSNALKRVLQNVELIAPNDSTILIHGETGTGKELIARVIHDLSLRKNRSMVKINCAALPPNLIESELFGHEKGAFTGAHSKRKGRFELAAGGTLFLDEIGELPIELQTKLLRVLQEGEFERVGGEKTIEIDVRIIAATNRNLQEAIKAGKFRPDLFYRLNVIPIELPALRERKEDIPALALFFARKYGRKQGKFFEKISNAAIKTLEQLDWPGNIRELENVIERTVVFCDGPVLKINQPVFIEGKKEITSGFQSLDEIQINHIRSVLKETNWVIEGTDGAAVILGLHPNTLRSRLKKLGIKKKE